MRYCVNCGAMNDTDAKFCSGCGKKFESAPEGDAVNTDYSTEQTRQANETQYQQNGYSEQNTNSQDYRSANQSYQQAPYGADPNVYSAYQGQGITENSYKGYSVASMILGIASIVLCFFIPILPLAAGIVGLVLGNKAKKYGDNGMAKAGRITSIIGIVLTAIIVILFIVGVVVLSAAIVGNPDFYNNIDNFYDYFNNFSY